MPLAKINNIDCYYEVRGKGAPLLLIAGLASDSQSWHTAPGKLAENFQVIVFDNRGAGRTQYSDESFDIAVLAGDTVALLDCLGIERANILGHSMGGYIAQEIAISYPERVDKLILECTAAFTSEKNKVLFTGLKQMLDGNGSYELFLKEFIRYLFTSKFFESEHRAHEFIKSALHYPYKQSRSDFEKQTEACREFSSRGRLDKIKAETLILSGEQDVLISPSEIEFLADKIRGASVKNIKGAAHALHIEASNDFVCVVSDFISSYLAPLPQKGEGWDDGDRC